MSFGQFHPFTTEIPKSIEEWENEKPIREDLLWRLLGDLPPAFVPQPHIQETSESECYTLQKITFDNGIGYTVYGYVVIPKGRTAPGPAILYHHYHGGKYNNGKNELFLNWPNEISTPAETLAKAGYVVLAIDTYAFGERQNQGPLGDGESGIRTEQALFKTFLWQGKTLWGMMVRDDLLALNYLASRSDVDPQRIGAMGMSMGSTRTWWLAALDKRIHVSVCVCCLTRYQTLIERGSVNEHGIYYYVPGLLHEKIDMESIVSMIAPRPLLTQTGDRDEGSPVDGVRQINNFVAEIYKLYGASDRFRGFVYEGIDHTYTPDMWRETLAWLDRYLK